jgi:hypothetical protein
VTVLAFHGENRAWSDGICRVCASAVRAEHRAARAARAAAAAERWPPSS